MMNPLQELISKYHRTTDDDERAEMIDQDFEPLADDEKWNFLLPLLMQPDTYDLVKAGIYGMIEVAEFSGTETARIKDEVVRALKSETDEMVRQHGFMSLSGDFRSYDDVLEFCMATVEDTQEDNDVRHAALGVITQSGAAEKVAALRKRLLGVKGFETYSTRFFEDRDKSIV